MKTSELSISWATLKRQKNEKVPFMIRLMMPMLWCLAGLFLVGPIWAGPVHSGLGADEATLVGINALHLSDFWDRSTEVWEIVNIVPGQRFFQGNPRPYQISGTGILDDNNGPFGGWSIGTSPADSHVLTASYTSTPNFPIWDDNISNYVSSWQPESSKQ